MNNIKHAKAYKDNDFRVAIMRADIRCFPFVVMSYGNNYYADDTV